MGKQFEEEIIANALDEIIYICDFETHKLVFLNEKGKKLRNISGDEYKNLSCCQLLIGNDSICSTCKNNEAEFVNETTSNFDAAADYKKNYVVKSKIINYMGKKARLSVAFSAEETGFIEESFRKKLDMERRVFSFANDTYIEQNINNAMQRMLQTVAEFYHCDECYVVEADLENNIIKKSYELNTSTGQFDVNKTIGLEFCETVLWSNLILKNKALAIHIDSIKDEFPSDYAYLKNYNIETVYCHPFDLNNGTKACVGAFNVKANINELKLLSMLAYFARTRINNRNLEMTNNRYKPSMALFPGAFFQVEAKVPYKILYANEEFHKLSGGSYDQENPEDNLMMDMIHYKDASFVLSELQSLNLEDKPSVVVSYRIVCHDKSIKWVKCGYAITKTSLDTILTAVAYDVTSEKLLERELKISDERLKIVLSQNKTLVWDYDTAKRTIVQTDYTASADKAISIVKNVPESLIENGTIHPESAEEIRELYARLTVGEKNVSASIKQKNATGEYQWYKIAYTNIFDETGKPVRAIGTSEFLIDDSEVKERYRREMLYRDVINPELIASYRINYTKNWVENYKIEDGASAPSGLITYSQLVKSKVGLYLSEDERGDIYQKLDYHTLLDNYKKGVNSISVEYLRDNCSGKKLWVALNINMMKEPNTGDIIGFAYVRNVDERKKNELSLKERAERDDLTGLYSKRTVELMIEEILSGKNTHDSLCSFLMVDLDNFKAINDNFGHLYGDRVIVDTAKTISNHFGEQTIIGRVGGDEYVVFLRNVASEKWVCEKVAGLCLNLEKTFKHGDQAIKITGSIGVVMVRPQTVDYKTIFEKADLSMYDAKQKGKNCYKLCSLVK